MTAWATASASLWPARPALAVEGRRRRARAAGRVVAEGVDVEALARPAPSSAQELRQAEVDRRGDLDVGRVAVHDHHPATRRLHQGRVVGALRLAGVGGPERGGPERLRRLHGDEAAPVDRAAAELAERVGHRDGRHGRVGARVDRRRAPAATRPGTGTGRAASCTRITSASSGTAASPARTDAERVAPPATTTVASGSGSPTRSAGTTTHHTVGCRRPPTRSAQSRTRCAAEGQVLLALAEALAAAAGHDDRPGGHGADVTAREIRH